MPSGVSVVIPTYRGATAAATTIQSLADQTLPADRFEVLLVVNGPAATDPGAFETLRKRFAGLRVRVLSTPTAGASLAWNIGVQAARMEWLTFLDDDDTITPTYLEVLLELAEPGVVPLAEIHDLLPDGSLDTSTRLNQLIVAAGGTRRSAIELPQAVGFNASKLLPTRWAQQAAYDLVLTNGQDVAYFGAIAMDHDVVFAAAAPDRGAAYVRAVSDTSMSRQSASFSFSVEQRLAVIERLDRARRRAPRRRRPVADHLIGSQTYLANRYLVANPDSRGDAVSSIDRRCLHTVPYDVLNRDLADLLVVVDDGARPRRGAVRAMEAVLGEGSPVDVVAVATRTNGATWVEDFWRSSPSRHLRGRLLRVARPVEASVAAIAKVFGPELPHRRVECLAGSAPARRLSRALETRVRGRRQ